MGQPQRKCGDGDRVLTWVYLAVLLWLSRAALVALNPSVMISIASTFLFPNLNLVVLELSLLSSTYVLTDPIFRDV
ncbi:hypothetical protein ES332_D09G139300v1 [Gossypium tomentosum]|uniref:Uncharacterized protein n=1 Tax=Gossypium tomentosum TaxID=34277 RepID=A0A5D2JH60_GOSTO|nr:hypothetical protein ES332_D09G139300v1 [Gossypium tomentosum]